MTQHEAQLNGFLVNVFNDILRLEEMCIRDRPTTSCVEPPNTSASSTSATSVDRPITS